MTNKPPLVDLVPHGTPRSSRMSAAEMAWIAAAPDTDWSFAEHAWWTDRIRVAEARERDERALSPTRFSRPDTVPAPQRPAAVRRPKKIVVRATPEFHRAVKLTALRQGMSMEAMTTLALEELMARGDGSHTQE